jgi:ribosomal-protein-alanine N-acetyltransferase
MGFTMEALNCILKYGFRTMKLHSIAAVVNPDNKASASLLVKSGFVLEGRFRDYMYFDGRFSDAEVYGLLDKD